VRALTAPGLAILAPLGVAAPARANDDDRTLLHLLSRATFGPRPNDIVRVCQMGASAWLESQLHPERIEDAATKPRCDLASVRTSIPDLLREYPHPDPKLREQVKNGEMTRREMMNRYPVRASARHPAMLSYLDNWLSAKPDFVVPGGPNRGRKAGLNENYARELMELHTLGVDGGYTQKDVTEVARVHRMEHRAAPAGRPLRRSGASDSRGRRPAGARATPHPASRWLTVDQLAPATVVLTTSLSTSPGQRVRRDEQVVGTSPGRSVGGAPAQLDEVARGIGVGLTAWTVGANDDGGTRLDEIRHVSRPIGPVEKLII
jgi:hypothetical protein